MIVLVFSLVKPGTSILLGFRQMQHNRDQWRTIRRANTALINGVGLDTVHKLSHLG